MNATLLAIADPHTRLRRRKATPALRGVFHLCRLIHVMLDAPSLCRRAAWGHASASGVRLGKCHLGEQYGTSRWVILSRKIHEANGTHVVKHGVV